jgi:hypothetical protein
MRNAWFLKPDEQDVPGSATVEWLGDAFVVFRRTMGGDVGPATNEMFQRFIADVGPDRIAARWEASEDHGSTWRKDFDLIFERP